MHAGKPQVQIGRKVLSQPAYKISITHMRVQLNQEHSALTIATLSKAHPSPIPNVHSAFVDILHDYC